MAEPKPFQFDSEQRSVGAAGGRRRSAWPWIALSLALHGAIVLFALVGAARGGHSELLGTLEVTVVGTPTAGDPDSRSAQGETETKPESSALPRPEAPPDRPTPTAIPQPPAVQTPSAAPTAPPPDMAEQPKRPEAAKVPDTIALPRKAEPLDTAPKEPRTESEDALKRPEPPAPSEPTPPRKVEQSEKAPAEPRPDQAPQIAPPPPTPTKVTAPPTLPRAKPTREAATPAKSVRAGVKQAPPGQTASLGAPSGGERLGRSDNDDATGMLSINLNPRFRAPPAPPIYPRQSIERDEEGIVLVRAFVDPSGAPQRVVIHKGSGFALLDEAALKAVQGWRFEPMMREGRATASWVQVPVRFRLN